MNLLTQGIKIWCISQLLHEAILRARYPDLADTPGWPFMDFYLKDHPLFTESGDLFKKVLEDVDLHIRSRCSS